MGCTLTALQRMFKRRMMVLHGETDALEDRVQRLEARYVRHGIDFDDLQYFEPEYVAEKLNVPLDLVLKKIRAGTWPSISFDDEGSTIYRVPAFWLTDRIAIPAEQYALMRHQWFSREKADAQAEKGP